METILRGGKKDFFSILDMHRFALTNPTPESNLDAKLLDSWVYANKVCRYTLLSILSK